MAEACGYSSRALSGWVCTLPLRHAGAHVPRPRTYAMAWSKRGNRRHLIASHEVLISGKAVCGIVVDVRTLSGERLPAADARKRTTCQRCAASA